MSSRIIWIVFDQFTLFNDVSDLACTDHSIRPGHLSDSMRQVKPLFPRCSPYHTENIRFHIHGVRLT